MLDEVEDIIVLPKFDDRTSGFDPNEVQLKPEVVSELREYIYVIASTYSNNVSTQHVSTMQQVGVESLQNLAHTLIIL